MTVENYSVYIGKLINRFELSLRVQHKQNFGFLEDKLIQWFEMYENKTK